MRRSSVRGIRQRALRKVRRGACEHRIDRAWARETQAMVDWALNLSGQGAALGELLRQGLMQLFRELVVRQVVRRLLADIQTGALAPEFNQQHGDADDAPA